MFWLRLSLPENKGVDQDDYFKAALSTFLPTEIVKRTLKIASEEQVRIEPVLRTPVAWSLRRYGTDPR